MTDEYVTVKLTSGGSWSNADNLSATPEDPHVDCPPGYAEWLVERSPYDFSYEDRPDDTDDGGEVETHNEPEESEGGAITASSFGGGEDTDEGSGDDGEGEVSTEDVFDPDEYLEETHHSTVKREVREGEHDDRLDSLLDADPSDSIVDAIYDRQDELEE